MANQVHESWCECACVFCICARLSLHGVDRREKMKEKYTQRHPYIIPIVCASVYKWRDQKNIIPRED